MPVIKLETRIQAPMEVCFDLCRSIDLHKISTSHTREEAVGGVVSGLIDMMRSIFIIVLSGLLALSSEAQPDLYEQTIENPFGLLNPSAPKEVGG